MAAKAATALATLLLASACSLAPDYKPPETTVPAAFKEAAPWQAASANVPASGDWWTAFGDQTLNDLEAKVVAGNFDLAVASARYEEARGVARQDRADLFPEIDAGTGVQYGKPSIVDTRGLPPHVGIGKTMGVSLAYEVDLFGQVHNQLAAGRANAVAAGFDVDALKLGLRSQLASVYFDLRGLDARIVLLRQTVDSYQRAFDLTDKRHTGGVSSGIDVSRAQAQLSSAKAELSTTALDRQRDEHTIAVLIGEAPANFSLPVVDDQTRPPQVPGGLPSALLERRPDITAAERRVAAANAQIGVARAALYPNITLGGSAGYDAGNSNWLSVPNSFWALGPLQAAMAIFDGGKRRAGVHIARAQYDEAAANYRETVLTAFREVEDDLAAQRLLATAEGDLSNAANAAQKTSDLALTRYRDGASDYLEVVTAQTAALDAERSLLVLRSQQLQIAADTFRAIGGNYANQDNKAPGGS
jgi:multidrug efflux system outer membrane protein